MMNTIWKPTNQVAEIAKKNKQNKILKQKINQEKNYMQKN